MSCDYCDWIERVLVAYEDKLPRKKPNPKRKSQRKRRLEPIIIIHGLPGPEKIQEYPNSNLETLKNIAIEKYRDLMRGESSIETTESTIIQLEKSRDPIGRVWRDTILVDDTGGFGCVSGIIEEQPITLAKEMLKRKEDIHRVIENFEDDNGIITRETTEETREKNSLNSNGESGSWSVIVRDLEENLSAGRTSWTPERDSKISINASTTVYGCGISIEDESCCSVCGDDGLIYFHALAKKISRLLEEKHKHSTSKSQIDGLTENFGRIGTVFLGPSERPVISCQSETFPWIYCCKERVYFGEQRGKIQMHVMESEETGCQCFYE